MDIGELLKIAMRRGASDVHIGVPAPPVMLVHGSLIAGANEPLAPLTTRRFLEEMVSKGQLEAFERSHELDFANNLPDVGRFRVNASLQRGPVEWTPGLSEAANGGLSGLAPATSQTDGSWANLIR